MGWGEGFREGGKDTISITLNIIKTETLESGLTCDTNIKTYICVYVHTVTNETTQTVRYTGRQTD